MWGGRGIAVSTTITQIIHSSLPHYLHSLLTVEGVAVSLQRGRSFYIFNLRFLDTEYINTFTLALITLFYLRLIVRGSY